MNDGALDHSVLDELQQAVGSEFLVELVDTFLSEGPGLIADLRQAAESGDADATRRAAHSLKSNASTFGAVALADAARKIETKGVGEAWEETLSELQDTFEHAITALKARRDD